MIHAGEGSYPSKLATAGLPTALIIAEHRGLVGCLMRQVCGTQVGGYCWFARQRDSLNL